MKLIEPLAITDATLLSSNVAETDWPAWSAGTAYVLGDKVIRTSTHRIYQRTVAGTTATAPELDLTNWLDIAPTNRWAMFDSVVGTLTTQATSISVTVRPVGVVNSLALLDISGDTLQVVMTDPIDGIVYDVTYSLSYTSGIIDWYSYFYTPIERKSGIIITDLPGYLSADIAITISNPGGSVSVGTCVAGSLQNLGHTKYGASVGIQDYSRKERDAFGNYTVVERPFNKKARFSCTVDADRVDRTHALLARRRALPTVYIGSEDYQSTVVYGFFKDFDIVIPYPTFSECSLEIEGLT